MQYYAHLYYITIFASIFLGAVVLRKQKDASGYYFFLFSIFASLWFLGYFLFFSELFSEQILLFISRFTFLVGILGVYSLLSFIIFFEKKRAPIPYHIAMAGFYGALTLLYIGSPFIIGGLDFDTSLSVFREREGSLFFLHVGLHVAFIILFFLFSYRGLKKLTGLHRVRLEHILLATFFFILTLLILQLLLPMFHIWILEREIIFFFFAYILYISFVLRRYYFHPVGYSIRRVFVFLLATILTVATYDISRNLLFPLAEKDGLYSYIDSSFLIILFASFWFLLSRYFFSRDIEEDFKEGLASLENSLAPIVDFVPFSDTLTRLFREIFSIHARIVLPQEDSAHHSTGLFTYFNASKERSFYINDIVFQSSQHISVDHTLFPKNILLVLPLFAKDSCYGILELGPKSFGDFYTKKEIKILVNFAHFLSAHIRYIETYTELKEFSKELDRRVDDKTIEYNNLISKQKELISIISHEVRSPLGSAIFQADSIMDDLGDTKKDGEIKKELKLLVDQLITTSDIITKIFSIQYLDITSVSLFRTSVHLSEWLSEIISVQVRMHEEIDFHIDIDDFGYVSLDKIQFSQVFSNILQNAIKFVSIHAPKITVIGRKKGDSIIIEFHDNGDGFREEEAEIMFEKFYRGTSTPVGLGMGLYLCKKIVEMHEGKISAHRSKLLGGAVITLEIPLALRSGTA